MMGLERDVVYYLFARSAVVEAVAVVVKKKQRRAQGGLVCIYVCVKVGPKGVNVFWRVLDRMISGQEKDGSVCDGNPRKSSEWGRGVLRVL